MIRVAAPGLPPWPCLMFDPQQRRAIVSVRHPTWRSYEWAIHTTEVFVWLGFGLMCWLIWDSTADFHLFTRLLFSLTAIGVSYPIATPVIRVGLCGFLARRVFATKTVLWFTEEAIIFRSRLFPKPVVIWRSWNGCPVRGRFVIQNDPEAVRHLGCLSQKRKAPKDHLNEAQMLEIVLTSVNKQSTLTADGQENILRSIPITEISGCFARRFAMVYAAAAALTSPAQTTAAPGQSDGTDIDLT